MELSARIDAFAKLGDFLTEIGSGVKCKSEISNKYFDRFNALIASAFQHNRWFEEENIRFALSSLGDSLKREKIEEWLRSYPELQQPTTDNRQPKTIGVIMAGNIPVVGFHDFICVLISGNKFAGKLSSDDKLLLPTIAEVLIVIEPKFKEQISFTENKLEDMDAFIATGSNNSARYFEHYFSKYPHLIRKNRNSVAVLTGNESKEDLKKLGDDIFRYYGLGCRNVSKLFVPKDYDFNKFFEGIFEFKTVLQNNKYANNYEYNRTIYLMSNTKLLDNNFLLLREDISLHSPVAVLFYEFYSDDETLLTRLRMDSAHLQCIVTNNKKIPLSIPFGSTQCPALSDYADRVDTMKFLLGL